MVVLTITRTGTIITVLAACTTTSRRRLLLRLAVDVEEVRVRVVPEHVLDLPGHRTGADHVQRPARRLVHKRRRRKGTVAPVMLDACTYRVVEVKSEKGRERGRLEGIHINRHY